MRTKSAINNLIAALLLSLVTAISGLILPKLFILTYGSEVNGLISSIKQFLVYLNLVEAGIGYAAMAMLYLPIREKNYNAINSILSAMRIQYIKSGWLFMALVLVLAFIYPLFVLDQISWIMSFLMVLVLGISGVSEFFLIGKYRVFLTAAQKGYIVSYIQLGGVLLNLFVTIILVLAEVNPIIVQLLASAIYVFRFILLRLYLNKKYPLVSYIEEPNYQALDKKGDVLIHQIVNLILVNTPIIIITIFCSLKEVSVFTIYLLVHNMIVMVLSVFMNGFQAVFGDIISEKKKDLLRRNYHLYECSFFPVVTITYIVTALLYMSFISLYTSGITDTNYIRPQLATLFVIIGILHNLRIPSMSILNSAGLFKETKVAAIIEAVISLVLSLILVQYWGIVGVLIGWLTAYLFRVFVLIKQISKDYVYGSVFPTLKVLMMNGIFGYITYFICKNFIHLSIYNYFGFLVCGILIVLIASILIIVFNLIIYRKEFFSMKEKLMNLFIKKQNMLN
ncbi:polysaccharide biosynthesis C-terminal domain-containing protein [Neobacillus thermocopriae]|uniref:polysaccharide biosynthesis C-terminal domain-containing protein n=1 Tax=Neobacillus thermocopriae TaxID=1215031 RepID=UPI002E21D481|nr:polysaccharide biosynthesis C-terminal domain-containing protein [Neobacillus thermocopriae]MED3713383.1 polysaccharide biosynthesis C-terminal domain-containing protein [Neobacillus thermocopriae]